MSNLLQFAFSGLTMGAIYALVALGFVVIYNSCDVVNFAQGEFVMLGGMVTVFGTLAGLPLVAAAALAVVLTAIVGLLLYWLAVRQAGNASIVTLIIITIGASLLVRGVASVVFDKNIHRLPDFISATSLDLYGASIQPQSLLVLGGSAALVLVLWWFLSHTLSGKGMRAVAADRLAARLVGINTSLTIALCFAMSGAIGAVGGILITPVALTSYDIGATLALKGFASAVLGGLGSPLGAVLGGLLLGLMEALGAGYVSSLYKDAIAFILLLAVLVFMPRGLVASAVTERV